jgi:hypothetical protein
MFGMVRKKRFNLAHVISAEEWDEGYDSQTPNFGPDRVRMVTFPGQVWHFEAGDAKDLLHAVDSQVIVDRPKGRGGKSGSTSPRLTSVSPAVPETAPPVRSPKRRR